MNIRRSEFVHTVRQYAAQGARDLPRYLYDQHFELSHQIGIPEIYQPRAWLDDHCILERAAMLAGGVAGGLSGAVAALLCPRRD